MSLGNALGIDHVAGESSVMYYLLRILEGFQSSSEEDLQHLSWFDMKKLYIHCSESVRIIRGVIIIIIRGQKVRFNSPQMRLLAGLLMLMGIIALWLICTTLILKGGLPIQCRPPFQCLVRERCHGGARHWLFFIFSYL